MSRHERRGSSDLRRTRQRFNERRKILVVTEGTETEPQYVEGLVAHLRATGVSVVPVRVKGVGRDPVRVVKEAERMREEQEFDDVWCLVDVDEHANLSAAIKRCESNSFSVAVSNPCFEIWILWHFQAHRAHATREHLRRQLRKFDVDGKSLPHDFPYHAHGDATARAAQSVSPRPDNPGSLVHELVERMRPDGRGGERRAGQNS